MCTKFNGVLCSLKNVLGYKIRYYCCCIGLNDVYILSAARTPIGSFQGKLSSLNTVQLGTKALTAAIQQSNISKDDIGEFVLGTYFSAGLGQTPPHQIALFSELSESIITSTVNKACASGMKAIMFACQLLTSYAHEVVAAGGAESLSNVPFILKRKHLRLGTITMPDLIFHDGLNCMFEKIDISQFAEQTVCDYNITREEQDDYAILSFQRATAALEDRIFEPEIVPVVVKKGKEEETICEDEQIRRLNIEKLRALPPETGPEGTITPGNSSSFNDGAAMLILATGNYVLKKNLKPLAKILSFCDVSLTPKKFCLSPSVAIPKALLLANITQDQVYRWEISETFAMTAIVNTRLLRLDPERVNIYGGAVSLGHPFGMTGARLIVHLAHTLPPGQVGVASLCHGSGGGSAMVIKKL